MWLTFSPAECCLDVDYDYCGSPILWLRVETVERHPTGRMQVVEYRSESLELIWMLHSPLRRSPLNMTTIEKYEKARSRWVNLICCEHWLNKQQPFRRHSHGALVHLCIWEKHMQKSAKKGTKFDVKSCGGVSRIQQSCGHHKLCMSRA